MVNSINKKEILDSYILHLDTISFLESDGDSKQEVIGYISILNDTGKSIEEQFEAGENLWKLLFKKALYSLTNDLEGTKNIFEYFEKYVEFEALLFGVDGFYRDHTIHSLWVYFVGQYLLNAGYIQREDIQISIDIFNDMQNNEAIIKHSNDIRNEVISNLDEMWCLISLTHDLAYPISSIEKINKKINSILPYFGRFIKQDFGLKESFIQTEIIKKLLKIICSDIQYDERKIPHQILKHDLYLALLNSFENYEHGVLSSYLIYKNLLPILKTPFYETGADVVHDENEIIKFLSNQSILKSIALHTCNLKQFSSYPSLDSLLVLSDEIEEFSRWTRAKNKRDYVSELCKVSIDINRENIIIEYLFDDSNIIINLEHFFKNKCKLFIHAFDDQLINLPYDTPFEYSKPPNIKIVVKDKIEIPYKEYSFEIENLDSKIFIEQLGVTPTTKTYSKKEDIEDYIGMT